uniref:FAD/NAD(P)-binding domain-containing protein n=1 Tax=Fagus sylvatica TaxID=28930 RepID=A0A2N9I0K2_FAGSY
MCLQNQTVELGEKKKKKRVVVIGGGAGGSVLAYSLRSVAEVILIDQKEYFNMPWASLRSMVEPSFAERSVINHTDYLPNVQMITSSATNITDSEVETADGHKVAYDYLVIATGHLEPAPKTREERLNEYKAEFEKIKSANTVLIVGGGPTGVELAGCPKKALDWLITKKVEVILDQAINLDSLSDGIVKTSAGETIRADCHFICTGRPMGSSWLRETILKDSLGIHDRLMVDQNLRVRGCKNIFAIGDITDIKEIKQGYMAQKHAQVTAKNLKLLIMGGSESKMATYKPGFGMAVVSLGRKEGVAQFPLLTISGYIPGFIKSEDLFVGRSRSSKLLGLKP